MDEKVDGCSENEAHPGSFARLRMLAHAALRWADATFNYSAIAVTHNFRGSPHIDRYVFAYTGEFLSR